MLPRVGAQRQIERDRGRGQLTTPLPFPPAKPGCVSSPHCFFQPMCGSRGQSQPSASCLADKVGEPLYPRLLGGRGGSRIPGSAARHMRGTFMSVMLVHNYLEDKRACMEGETQSNKALERGWIAFSGN